MDFPRVPALTTSNILPQNLSFPRKPVPRFITKLVGVARAPAETSTPLGIWIYRGKSLLSTTGV